MRNLLKSLFDIRPQLMVASMAILIVISGFGLQGVLKETIAGLTRDQGELVAAACFVVPAAIYLGIYSYLVAKWPALRERYAKHQQNRAKEKAYRKDYWR